MVSVHLRLALLLGLGNYWARAGIRLRVVLPPPKTVTCT